MIQIHSDLSPNPCPPRRGALKIAPLPALRAASLTQGRGWGLGLYWTQLQTILSCINKYNPT